MVSPAEACPIECCRNIGGTLDPGREDHLNTRLVAADPARQPKPIHVTRHLHIAEHDVDRHGICCSFEACSA
jgi:hypothetical protein